MVIMLSGEPATCVGFSPLVQSFNTEATVLSAMRRANRKMANGEEQARPLVARYYYHVSIHHFYRTIDAESFSRSHNVRSG